MCACAHFVCLPPFLPANFKEQAGFHNHVRDPRLELVATGIILLLKSFRTGNALGASMLMERRHVKDSKLVTFYQSRC
jgi:hypothetical protein